MPNYPVAYFSFIASIFFMTLGLVTAGVISQRIADRLMECMLIALLSGLVIVIGVILIFLISKLFEG